jgi:hypothetical protein
MATRIDVALETTPKRTFAVALDWPGFARAGKTAELALEALLAQAPRYAPIGGVAFDADLELVVVETIEGNATTEFGAPGRVTEADRRPLDETEAARRADLVAAAWRYLEATVAAAPAELRKGPRGGGRDTAKMFDHVLTAEHAYAQVMGIRVPAPNAGDRQSIDTLRSAVLAVLREPSDGSPLAGKRWTSRYAATRIAWHVLDHAWEIEDRTE